MSKLHYPIFLSFLAALSTGCTSNISSKHATAVAKVNIEPGYQYRLPKTSFDVTADFEATGCTIDPSNNTLSILYAAKVKIDKIESGDPDASYILDYEALDALTKLTRMELATTPTGLLTQCHQLKPPALAGARNPGAWTRGCSSAFTGFAPQFSACATQTPA